MKDCAIPDFHQLVNYPDYLSKMRPNGTESSGIRFDGQRQEAMCDVWEAFASVPHRL
jgi:hypothetical protein